VVKQKLALRTSAWNWHTSLFLTLHWPKWQKRVWQLRAKENNSPSGRGGEETVIL
jgi:hypothetical protein